MVNDTMGWKMEPPLPKRETPLHRHRILAKLEYLRQLATDSAYITPQGPTESVKT